MAILLPVMIILAWLVILVCIGVVVCCKRRNSREASQLRAMYGAAYGVRPTTYESKRKESTYEDHLERAARLGGQPALSGQQVSLRSRFYSSSAVFFSRVNPCVWCVLGGKSVVVRQLLEPSASLESLSGTSLHTRTTVTAEFR